MEAPLTDQELNALISLLDDEDREVKEHVRGRLLALGADLIPYLENQWESSFNPSIQKELEELIHDLQFAQLKTRLQTWAASERRDLLEGLWLVNTYLYPDLSLEQLNAKLQQLYFDVWSNFSDEGDAVEQVQLLNHLLFSRLRFSANTKNFHAPSNNMLHQVLESRKGNPISLSMVYLLVANRLGLPVFGVNLPNLFVLTYKFDGQQFYINPFNKGILFSRKDVEHYLEHLRLPAKDSYFEPCDSMAIIRRFFRNLGLSFEKLGNPERVEEIRELLRLLQGEEDRS